MLPEPFGESSVAFEWGATGATALSAAGAEIAVVIDVLSFTTTVSVALDAGATVLPYRWAADDAEAYASARGAVLARGRRAAGQGAVSLSPAAMRANVHAGDRIVLPSPNGATIAHQLAAGGVTVVAACLRNTQAVAAWIGDRRPDRLAVIAAGERWPDGSLRPATEDLLGAGAVLDAVATSSCTAEAAVVRAAFRATADVAGAVRDSLSGRELTGSGFAADVDIAVEVGASSVVPVLVDDAFVVSAD